MLRTTTCHEDNDFELIANCFLMNVTKKPITRGSKANAETNVVPKVHKIEKDIKEDSVNPNSRFSLVLYLTNSKNKITKPIAAIYSERICVPRDSCPVNDINTRKDNTKAIFVN